MKVINIPVAFEERGFLFASIHELEDFQGDLKSISEESLEKLKSGIVANGFIVPFYVWEDSGIYKILDGHQRKIALLSLQADGYEIPKLPIVQLYGESEADAKLVLLSITSQYGEFDVKELESWVDSLSDELASVFRFTDSEIKFDLPEIDIDSEEEPSEDKLKMKCCPNCGHEW